MFGPPSTDSILELRWTCRCHRATTSALLQELQHGPIAVGVDASPLESYRPGWSSTKSRTPYVVSADATKCETMCGRDETCTQECHDVASKAAAAQQTPTVDHAVDNSSTVAQPELMNGRTRHSRAPSFS